MTEPAIEKMTLGQASAIGPLLYANGEPIRAVDASTPCWVVWGSMDDPACIYLNEGDALFELDRLRNRSEDEGGE